MLQIPETIDDYVSLINSNTFFTQAGYGDGEWLCITGASGGNSTGTSYTKELREKLIITLKDPRFTYYAHNPGLRYQKMVMDWWIPNFASPKDKSFSFDHALTWKSIISGANVNGHFGDILRSFDDRKILIVGPKHLRPLRDIHVVDYDHFVEIPGVDAYRKLDSILSEIRQVIDKTQVNLILFCAGMTTNVLMWELLGMDCRQNLSMLDMGACFDPYVGQNTRKSYRKPIFQERKANSLARLKALREA